MEKITIGDLVLWPSIPRAQMCGTSIKLSVRQWELLRALAYCSEHLVTHRMLQAVMQYNRPHGIRKSSVMIAISNLRRILASYAQGRNFIQLVPRHGYVLKDPGLISLEPREHKLAA